MEEGQMNKVKFSDIKQSIRWSAMTANGLEIAVRNPTSAEIKEVLLDVEKLLDKHSEKEYGAQLLLYLSNRFSNLEFESADELELIDEYATELSAGYIKALMDVFNGVLAYAEDSINIKSYISKIKHSK